MLAFVGTAVVGLSGTFFTDTEISTGNTFTAGAIDLKIDNESYVTNEAGVLVASSGNSWVLDDLVGKLFFNFFDLKPGDVGEDTISLHVNSNDAWACMNIAITDTPENDVTEPEGEVDGTPDVGELQDELYFAFWADDGDNVYETDEVIFEEGLAASLFDGVNMVLADSTGNVWDTTGPLQGGGEYVYHVGKVWCYGELEETPYVQDLLNTFGPLDRGTGFACSGSSVSNVSQTDGIMADVTFYAEQSRNNDNFVCSEQEPTGVVLDIIDVGDSNSVSMTDHSASGWLDYVQGDYGTQDGGDSIAMVWGDGGFCDTNNDDASFVLDAGTEIATTLKLRHYDGVSQDSFDVYVNSILVHSYVSLGNGAESPDYWYTTEIPVSFTGLATIKIVSTGAEGAYCAYSSSPAYYGQVALNWAEITN